MPAPDDIYQKDVDFTSLALQYPDFAKRYVMNIQQVHVGFRNFPHEDMTRKLGGYHHLTW